jgi:hypothetical protein
VIKASADRVQRRLYVLKRDLHLLAGTGAHLAGPVDPKLACKIDSTAGSGHFYHMAVAGGLLHRVGIRKTDVVWHI